MTGLGNTAVQQCLGLSVGNEITAISQSQRAKTIIVYVDIYDQLGATNICSNGKNNFGKLFALHSNLSFKTKHKMEFQILNLNRMVFCLAWTEISLRGFLFL